MPGWSNGVSTLHLGPKFGHFKPHPEHAACTEWEAKWYHLKAAQSTAVDVKLVLVGSGWFGLSFHGIEHFIWSQKNPCMKVRLGFVGKDA